MTVLQISIANRLLKYLALQGQANVDDYFHHLTNGSNGIITEDHGQIGMVRAQLLGLHLIEPLGNDQYLYSITSMGVKAATIGLESWLSLQTNNDRKIDTILTETKDRHSFTHLYRTFINAASSQNEIDNLMEEMISKGLIKKEENSYHEMDVIVLANQGNEIKNHGGWMKQIMEQMTDEQKLHRILEYIIITNPDQYFWNTENLLPAFDNLLNQYELGSLCQRLIDEGIVIDCSSKSGFGIGFVERSKHAYGGKEYLKFVKAKATPIPIINIHQGQHISGIVHGSVSQENIRTKNFNAPADVKKDGILKTIIIAIVGTVVAALLLKYIFEIG